MLKFMLSALIGLLPQLSLANPLHITGHFDLGQQQITGFMQTPMGGTLGTTSFQRPSFAELDYYQDPTYSWGLGGQWYDYQLYLSHQKLMPATTHILTYPLISHNQHLAADQELSVNTRFSWYHLTLAKEYAPLLKHNLVLSPQVTTNLVQYRYQFSTTQQGSIRQFNFSNLNLGLLAKYHWNAHWSTQLHIQHTLPLFNSSITEGHIQINYVVHNANMQLSPYLNLYGLTLEMKDKQRVPNHICYRVKAGLKIGLMLQW